MASFHVNTSLKTAKLQRSAHACLAWQIARSLKTARARLRRTKCACVCILCLLSIRYCCLSLSSYFSFTAKNNLYCSYTTANVYSGNCLSLTKYTQVHCPWFSISTNIGFLVLFIQVAGIIPLGIECIYRPHSQENCQPSSNEPDCLHKEITVEPSLCIYVRP